MNSLKELASKFYRQTTAPLRQLPDFLVIGVVKGGTTSIFKYISQHPQVAPGIAKEVKYFKNNNYAKHDLNWYRSHFPLNRQITKDMRITGEASPQYFHNPEAPSRVHQVMPNAKLIVLLRNPVDRAYSHYSMNKRNLKQKRGVEVQAEFKKVVEEEMDLLSRFRPPAPPSENTHSYTKENSAIGRKCFHLASGIYINSLHRWLSFFAKENFLVLKSEDLFENPELITDQVYQFLCLSSHQGVYDVFNEGSRQTIDKDLRERLVEFYKPYNQILYDYLDRDFQWDS
jgi:hypothetical protein